ncbi:MAG TPA: MFS transporter [Thermoanaerobaculia bacterium]|nr:MFS transporter [Thermoanaerobaculia bacterium]
MSQDSKAPDTATDPPKPRKPGLGDVFRALRQPKVAIMLGLGFSSGLPFFLTAATLGYWMRDEGVSLKAIGFLSWVGLAYSFKFLWSPLIDRLDAPWLGKRLGRRRGWILAAQVLIAGGLLAMASTGPRHGLVALGAAALVVAFASASQDIVVDAWRIEAAETEEELGLLSSTYQLGYRIAVITSDALILFAANHLGWPISYGLMAALMLIGVTATLKATEPAGADEVLHQKSAEAPLWTFRGLFDAVAGPFIAFFRTWGWIGLLMLLFISLYRLPEFVMGPMATPFYHDLGISKDMVGAVRGTVGLAASFLGIAVGGLLVARLGYMRGLIVGGIVQGLGIASFALLGIYGGDPRLFGVVMMCDNFGVSIAGVALVTYMSSLTSLGYTATQYALLSSAYAIIGKFLKGFSGAVVEGLQHQGHTLMESYALFFVGAGAIGLPAILLCLWLAAVQRRNQGRNRPVPAS